MPEEGGVTDFDQLNALLMAAGCELQAAGEDLCGHAGFVEVARSLQRAGEILAGARPARDE